MSETPEGVRLAIRVSAGRRHAGIDGVEGGRLKVMVHAPAREGRANREVGALIGRALGVPRAYVVIEMGGSSPQKVLSVRGVTRDDVRERLGL